ncbi:RNA polymerase sigma-70 factor (ECF subfamily) [Paenibacillus cellulosilyticus]|uniref:RNA polymerase sigma-70 factor (ECF subfamily) n=1 Tax=Paenibacillus cellulosilyticus TaxID=375489 RepID=A0A2V2YZA0_9BACL|nr:sigma-70 family RNA polymerase sigma factor [Paenibacillus cellulosilyticus]PWW07252.1 RNA polymerase sigma-70 factor (ECF subfamily) [Paenibacillus cellulosilyticus]QKS44558.1 sigma-70 family RNA polymerase sigma factor [Paenibacillus cellulosilyticus]
MELTKLMVKAAAGDADAFIELIRQLESSLHFMAKSILSKDEDVADALQETILKAYKAIPSLREPKYFKTWIFRILINECHNLIAKCADSVAYADVPTIPSSSDDYEKVDLREAVDRLDEPQRIVVILHYLEDLPLRQVAKVLDISESAVKMRLSRARDTLYQALTSRQERKMNYGSI